MSLVWTAGARKQLLPRTREGTTLPKAVPVGAAWGLVRRALKTGRRDIIAETFQRGRADAKPPFAALMRKCEAIARSSSMPSFDDANVAAAFALLMAKHVNHALVTAVYPHQGGLPFAFEVALRMLEMEAEGRPLHLRARVQPVEPDLAWRERLRGQPDDIRAECKDRAARLWPTASLPQKATIAHALFEELDWADDVCRETSEKATATFSPEALYPIVRDKDVAFALVRKRDKGRSLLELVATFGEELLPLLVEVADAPRDNETRHVAEALAQFDDARAAKALAPLVKYAAARSHVQSYFVRYPQFAEALAPVAADTKLAAKVARDVLAGAKRARGAYDGATEATLEELPTVFAGGSKKPNLASEPTAPRLATTPLHRPMKIAWLRAERERALALRRRQTHNVPDATPATIEDHARRVKKGRSVSFFCHRGERLPDASVLAVWTSGIFAYDASGAERLQYALAKFQDQAEEGLERFVAKRPWNHDDVSFLLRVGSTRIALAMAHLRTSATHDRLGSSWLHHQAPFAVMGLVPHALGGDAEAAHALVRLAAGGTDVIGFAAPYGAEVQSALRALLERGATVVRPAKPPRLGSSWNRATLTRPVLLSGKLLPLEAVDTLGALLAAAGSDATPAIAAVKAACTPRSLAELSWDAARAWEHDGHKRRDKWMLLSLVHFADDEVVRRMTPGVRVDFAVEVLERIGTPVALMELLTIAVRAQTSGDPKLAARIETIVEQAAWLRALDKDELEEELAPVKTLESDGTVSLDFGPRKLKVGFDSHLEPYVINEAGGRARALAPARSDDDPERALAAKELWRGLKEDVAVLAARRIAGLRRAMVSGRSWTPPRFHQVWIHNGLMKHIARGLVWTDGTTSFRIAEDGSLSTSSDAGFTLASDAVVRVLHPLRAPREELDLWRALFADYRIVQPFPQLERTPLERPPAPGNRMTWPLFAPPNELTASLLARDFARASRPGAWSFRRELARGGAITIEVKAVAVPDELVIVLSGADLDMVEVADILDELQATARSPSSLRHP